MAAVVDEDGAERIAEGKERGGGNGSGFSSGAREGEGWERREERSGDGD